MIETLPSSVGIIYEGELVGDYGIPNIRDPINTIQYYKDIGNNIFMNKTFTYYDMTSVVNFIYFWFIIDLGNEHTQINQPLKVYA
jgi:hypothetical protein